MNDSFEALEKAFDNYTAEHGRAAANRVVNDSAGTMNIREVDEADRAKVIDALGASAQNLSWDELHTRAYARWNRKKPDPNFPPREE